MNLYKKKLSVFILAISAFLTLSSCSTTIENKNPLGKTFPTIKGKALDGKKWTLPQDIMKKNSILLIGYDQDAQFDIDRWLIGLDMKKVTTNIFEIPTVTGFIPKLISEKIDSGMRRGIPENLWKIVITVYDDADKVVQFTGNQKPLNARVIALDKDGKTIYFSDNGFSVDNLNSLIEALKK